MRIRELVIAMLLCYGCMPVVYSQDMPDLPAKSAGKTTQKYIDAVNVKSSKVSQNIEKHTLKYLSQLEKQEAAIKGKLSKIDSLAANNIFATSTAKYQEIQNKVRNKSTSLLNKSGKYLPWLDSASTSLRFLKKNQLASAGNGSVAKLNSTIGKVKELENQFKQAASVKDFIRERKEYLAEQLKDYNLGAELKKYNTTAYYYSQQINDYREAVSNPDKAERKALELLNKFPAFQDFISKNSMLSSLFAVPGNGDPTGIAQNMVAAQTRASVQGLIQNQIAAAGPGGQSIFQENMLDAQNSMSSLKNKFEQLGSNGGGDITMPEYKPNPNKTRSFLKRIEYGASLQSVKSNIFFPVTTDIAFSAGYLLWKQNVIGIKGSYKIGWGKDIRHIAITSEGVGFGSFLDIKLKGNIYASGGFEFNFQQPEDSFPQMHRTNLHDWTTSGLLGISKMVSLKSKVFKKTKIQLLWDFLSYQQVPRTKAVKFRIGYSF